MAITGMRVRHAYAELAAPMRSRGNVGYTEFFHTGSERQRISAVELVSDSGCLGVTLLPGGPDVVEAFLEAIAWPTLRAQEAHRVRHLCAALLARAAESDDPVPHGLIRRLEFALWDLAAREAGMPLYRWLGGGPQRRVPVYAGGGSLCWNPLPLLVEETEQLLARGFRALKIKIGHGPDEDVEIVRVLREVAGPDVAMMVDANRAYDVAGALRLLPVLADLGYRWFEEPLGEEDPAAWRRLRAATPVAIAGGEGFHSLAQVAQAAAEEMLAIYQCDAGAMGLVELLAVASLVGERGCRLTPHSCNNAIGFVVALHLHLAIPNGELQEYETFANPFVQEIFTEPFPVPRQGMVDLPSAPGLGLQVDWERVRRFTLA